MEMIILPNKSYPIPKYLYKRQIDIVRSKIIKRKYAYLFYRKAVSTILPSQAENHYRFNLKRNLLKRWVSSWYEARVEWKLVIRAEIHYNLSLMNNALRRMVYFLVLQKAQRLKEQLAEAHFSKNQKKLHFHSVFSKWKQFVEYRLYRKSRKKLSRDFFKAKFDPKIVQIFMNKWKIYTRISKREKRRLHDANVSYNRKLLLRTFNDLKIYANIKKSKRIIYQDIKKVYEKKLMQKFLTFWKIFTDDSLNEKQNNILANLHYASTLTKNALRQILNNKIKNQEIKAKCYALKNSLDLRMKRCYFRRFFIHHLDTKIKKHKMTIAQKHSENKLKVLVLNDWKDFHRHCLDEKEKTAEKLHEFYHRFTRKRMESVFELWGRFTEHHQQKKHKIAMADSFSKIILLRKFLKNWQQFFSYKQLKKSKVKIAEKFYVSTYLTKWRAFSKEEVKFKENLLKAEEYYKRKLLKETLTIIGKAGINKKEEIFQNSKAKLVNRLFLAQKYFGKWKRKVIFESPRKTIDKLRNSSQENKENIAHLANTDWYPICFIAPRVYKK